MSFAEIDNNKDGKISPVELSTVMPSVSMESFKQYDRNGDGFLDMNEYRSVRK
jgi:Ca2+-binding EF-hand superfamily protein